MKNTLILVALMIIALVGCESDNESIDDQQQTALLTINAKSGLEVQTQSTNNVVVDEFLINIKNIELEMTENSSSSGSDDDNSDDSSDDGSDDDGSDDDGSDDESDDSSDDDNDDDADDLTLDEMPQEIQDYLNINYPNDPFCEGELEDDEPYTYEVELQSGTEIYFMADFTVYDIDVESEGCNDEDDDDDENDTDTFGGDDEVDLLGPFVLDLSSGTATVTTIDVPAGEYEEVEFEMDVNNDASSPIFGMSIMIDGTLDGTPFTFFHTVDEEFEIDYEDAGQNLIVSGGQPVSLTFDFNMGAVLSVVDLSTAVDGNADGTIEISPDNVDGNAALADQIKNEISRLAELSDD